MTLDPKSIADTIENLVQEAVDKPINKTFKRGIVASYQGQFANVYVEGNTVATQNIICLSSYAPAIGDKVLVLSIGSTGSNLVVLGSLQGGATVSSYSLMAALSSNFDVVGAGTWTEMPFDMVIYNSGFENVSGQSQWTVPVTGFYDYSYVHRVNDRSGSSSVLTRMNVHDINGTNTGTGFGDEEESSTDLGSIYTTSGTVYAEMGQNIQFQLLLSGPGNFRLDGMNTMSDDNRSFATKIFIGLRK